MAAERSGKFPQTEAWVKGLCAHLEAKTGEKWTLARLAGEARVNYGLLRRWHTGRNEPKAGNMRRLSAFAHKHGYQSASDYPVDRKNNGAEPSSMLSTVEAALIEHFRKLSGDRQAEVVVELKKEAAISSRPPAALNPKA